MERTTELSRSWSAWTGTSKDLDRLAELVEGLIDKRREAELSKVGDPPEAELAEYQVRERARINRDYKVVVKIETLDETVVGDYSEVMREFDSRVYVGLTMGLPPRLLSSDALQLSFKPRQNGSSELRVVSALSVWA